MYLLIHIKTCLICFFLRINSTRLHVEQDHEEVFADNLADDITLQHELCFECHLEGAGGTSAARTSAVARDARSRTHFPGAFRSCLHLVAASAQCQREVRRRGTDRNLPSLTSVEDRDCPHGASPHERHPCCYCWP